MRNLPLPSLFAPLFLTLATWLGIVGCGPSASGPDAAQASAAAPDSSAAAIAGYPSRSITLICPWAAGGGTDRLSRFIADQLQRRLGKPVVVVNRTGGSGAVGHLAGATAPPDGYTLTMATFELSTMHWMGLTPLTHQDFTPLLQLNGDAAALMVRTDAPWKSLADLLAHLKANPGKVKMSGTSTGGAWDLARAGFLLAAKLPVDSVLWIPTQGSAPSLVELLGGHIDVVCCSVPEAASQIEAGQLRVLAVMSGERLAEYPDLPTARELGVDWEAIGWRGVVLPRNASPDLVELLQGHLRAITESPEFLDFMKKNGFATARRGPADFRAFLEAQDTQWHEVIQAAGYARP